MRAFAYELASEFLGAAGMPVIPSDGRGYLYVRYPNAPRQAFTTVSAADVIQDKADLRVFKDALVLVGATASDLHDQQYTPTSDQQPMSGVEIHASLVDTILGRHWLVPLAPWLAAMLLVAAGVFLGLLVPFVRARVSATVAVLVWIGWCIGAFFAFDRGLLVDILWPSLVLVFAYVAIVGERWADTEHHRREVRQAFSRYVSPSVVEALLKDPSKLKLGGERRRMTVLFSDLRGFTTLSEGLAPEKLVEVLNRYLHAMTEIVFEEGGVLDKYIGDAVMAFWNAPFDQADHATRGLRTAVRMKKKLKEMNETGAFPKGITLKVGVGLNAGEMVVGNIGGEQRYDYTVIGDSVNLASRTESLCKEYGAEILITENVFNELKGEFLLRKLDKVAVKGKKEPILLYQVFGMKDDVTPALAERISGFEEALAAYFGRRFEDAIGLCQTLLAATPDDVAVQHLLERCQMYRETPPSAEWDGTWVMTKK
jgi:adenylate cyclase